jgi:ubiquinone/menaquinone biosynthesis C-methylase UbiE
MGTHAAHYNSTWETFLRKTLEAAYTTIDVESLRQDALARQAPLRILDVACGTGLLLERVAHLFPSAELHGIDASEEMLAQARQLLQHYPNVQLRQVQLSGGAAARLPYPFAFFDLITCTNALHYFQEPAAVLRNFNDLLTERGQLILEDYVLRGFPFPGKWFEWAIRIYDPEHRSLHSKKEARRLCQQSGLQVEAARVFPIGFFCRGWVMRASHGRLVVR